MLPTDGAEEGADLDELEDGALAFDEGFETREWVEQFENARGQLERRLNRELTNREARTIADDLIKNDARPNLDDMESSYLRLLGTATRTEILKTAAR